MITSNASAATSTDAIHAALRQRVAAGCPWFEALLEAVAAWTLAEETVGERHYRYLIGGEAFDWLLLAERLCESLDGYIPLREREELLFFGRPPLDFNEEDLRRAIGYQKYRAHLNYFYGVLVEEMLQLAVEEELHKEQRSCVWRDGQQPLDEAVFLRIYDRGRAELLAAFRRERELPAADDISLGDLKEFTYWLFKYRLRQCDPARIASDTRRALALLERLRSRCRPLSVARI